MLTITNTFHSHFQSFAASASLNNSTNELTTTNNSLHLQSSDHSSSICFLYPPSSNDTHNSNQQDAYSTSIQLAPLHTQHHQSLIECALLTAESTEHRFEGIEQEEEDSMEAGDVEGEYGMKSVCLKRRILGRDIKIF